MAISDILSDACWSIRDWRDEFPKMYDGDKHMSAALNNLLDHMDGLRAVLDSHPKEAQAAFKAYLASWPNPPK